MTKQRLVAALVPVLLLTAAVGAQATIITVDPDSFAAGTDLTAAFSGVTLSVVGPGYPSSGPVRSVTASGFVASTGTRIFGHDGGLPEYWRDFGFLNLRIDFSSPVQWVAIDAISDDSSDFGYLQVFSAGGALLGTYTTLQLGIGDFETMSFSAPAIGYLLVGGTDNQSAIGLDNLQYETAAVPEPGTILLLGAGIAGLAARRKRA